jgi:DNA-binding CsgD family transcriptional regulator
MLLGRGMLKQEQLIESIADMQLGNITIDDWLQKLTEIVDCTAAGTIVWLGSNPHQNIAHFSESFQDFPLNWLPVAEQIIRRSDSNKSDYLDEMAKALNIEDSFPDSPLKVSSQLIIILDEGPTRQLLILQHENNHAGWSSNDRDELSVILPGMRKANELHKSVNLTDNRLDIANKVLDSAPRGIVALSPKGHVLRANTLAADLFANKDSFTEVDNKLHIMNRQVQAQFEEKLALIAACKLNDLGGFVWNRGFTTPENHQKLQIVLRAYPLENSHLESNSFDRFVVLFIHIPADCTRPSADDLKDFFGLTGAQARLVVSLLDGNSITDAAKQNNIKLNTARSHMQSIYTTMGVDGHADLMHLLSMTLVNYEPKY